MIKIEENLAAIGFGRCRDQADCGWRTVRLEQPAAPAAPRPAPEPACSRELLRWRDRLRRSPRPSPYRISRA